MRATKVVLEEATILSFWKGSQEEHCRATQSLEPSRPRWIGRSVPTIHGDKTVDHCSVARCFVLQCTHVTSLNAQYIMLCTLCEIRHCCTAF